MDPPWRIGYRTLSRDCAPSRVVPTPAHKSSDYSLPAIDDARRVKVRSDFVLGLGANSQKLYFGRWVGW